MWRVTKHDAGQRLDFEIVQVFALLLREIAHLGLGKLDVIEIALGHLRNGGFRSSCGDRRKSFG